MNLATGLPPAHATRSSARTMVSPTSKERAAAMAEERAEELHQLEVARLRRKGDQEEAQEARLNRKAEQEELLFQAQLIALKAPAQQPAAQMQDAEGETTPEVKSLTAVLPGIASTHLVAIHKNRFLAENLSKLRRGRREEDTTGQIMFLNGTLSTTRVKGSMKDFGPTINIWSEGFHNYLIANHSLYKGTFPELMYGMICFYIKIASLAEIYIWSGGVLELAIAYMNDITTNGRGLTSEAWSTIPQEWIDIYCGPMKILSRKPASTSLPSSSSSLTSKTKTICDHFNTSQCGFGSSCYRLHICAHCKGEHPLSKCSTAPK
jgi:hypothetical protein